MRVNVYAEELTSDVEFVEKESRGVKFAGIRLRTVPLPSFNAVLGDEAGAVTIWIRSGNGADRARLRCLLVKACELLK